jgi:hypothetical protein
MFGVLNAPKMCSCYSRFLPDGARANYTSNYTLEMFEDGDLHLLPQDYVVHYSLKKVKFHVDNFFNGNKLLGEIPVANIM